jgi:hypothetical protein
VLALTINWTRCIAVLRDSTLIFVCNDFTDIILLIYSLDLILNDGTMYHAYQTLSFDS